MHQAHEATKNRTGGVGGSDSISSNIGNSGAGFSGDSKTLRSRLSESLRACAAHGYTLAPANVFCVRMLFRVTAVDLKPLEQRQDATFCTCMCTSTRRQPAQNTTFADEDMLGIDCDETCKDKESIAYNHPKRVRKKSRVALESLIPVSVTVTDASAPSSKDAKNSHSRGASARPESLATADVKTCEFCKARRAREQETGSVLLSGSLSSVSHSLLPSRAASGSPVSAATTLACARVFEALLGTAFAYERVSPEERRSGLSATTTSASIELPEETAASTPKTRTKDSIRHVSRAALAASFSSAISAISVPSADSSNPALRREPERSECTYSSRGNPLCAFRGGCSLSSEMAWHRWFSTVSDAPQREFVHACSELIAQDSHSEDAFCLNPHTSALGLQDVLSVTCVWTRRAYAYTDADVRSLANWFSAWMPRPASCHGAAVSLRPMLLQRVRGTSAVLHALQAD